MTQTQPNVKRLRQIMIGKRRALPPEEQLKAAQAALSLWFQDQRLRQAQHIAAFWSVQGELPTQPFLQSNFLEKKNLYLPRIDPINKRTLIFAPFSKESQLVKGTFGIPEPQISPEKAVALDIFDIVLMPLVACDERGNRVGMGGGFYDRTFAQLHQERRKGPATGQTQRTILVGWCYEWQQIAILRPNQWDIPLDAIVTNHKIQWFNQNAAP